MLKRERGREGGRRKGKKSCFYPPNFVAGGKRRRARASKIVSEKELKEIEEHTRLTFRMLPTRFF